MISRLVIIKFLNGHKIFFATCSEEEISYIKKFENSDYKEDMWNLNFNLKVD